MIKQKERNWFQEVIYISSVRKKYIDEKPEEFDEARK